MFGGGILFFVSLGANGTTAVGDTNVDERCVDGGVVVDVRVTVVYLVRPPCLGMTGPWWDPVRYRTCIDGTFFKHTQTKTCWRSCAGAPDTH